MAEDDPKITIKTTARLYKRSTGHNEPGITFDSLQAALLETYEQANAIGWETKVLDSFSAWIRAKRVDANG